MGRSNPIETLRYILRHPFECSPKNSAASRAKQYTFALESASFYLDTDSKEWRAINYLVRNDQAIFNFGGKDAVRPAIELAIRNMERDLRGA